MNRLVCVGTHCKKLAGHRSRCKGSSNDPFHHTIGFQGNRLPFCTYSSSQFYSSSLWELYGKKKEVIRKLGGCKKMQIIRKKIIVGDIIKY